MFILWQYSDLIWGKTSGINKNSGNHDLQLFCSNLGQEPISPIWKHYNLYLHLIFRPNLEELKSLLGDLGANYVVTEEELKSSEMKEIMKVSGMLTDCVKRWARVAQWKECLPPTSVARIRILEVTPYVGWVCCWFSPCSERFSSGYSGFPLSSKTNISKFQFDLEWWTKNHFVDVPPLNH